MTRKDYVLIATVIRQTVELVRLRLGGGKQRAALDTLEDLINRLSEDLQIDNPRFNGAKFRRAAYGHDFNA